MSEQNSSLRIAYAIQNVGGIDFRQDVGDTVPVKQTLLGLRRAGHQVTCFQLQGRSIVAMDDVSDPATARPTPLKLSGSRSFLKVESGLRRLQRVLGLPYFAIIDACRFYEASFRHFSAFDLCHEHNGLFCVGAALACWRLGLPYMLTFSADPLFERGLGGRPLRGLHRLVAAREAAFTYQLAERILCVSEPAKRHLVKSWQVDPEKVVVMPNGVDLNIFQPDYDPRPVRAELGLNGEPVIGFAGGFQHWHGLEQLVESLAQIRAEIPDTKLLLIGDGRARPSIERKISEMGLESAVIITGLVPQTRVPEMLAVADIAVLPYPKLPKELWFSPLKLYEYMASGKAIVASRDGQIADVIQDGQNGILVESGDVNDLAQKTIRLLGDSAERTRLGQNARIQAVKYHSWDQYIRRLEAIYRRVLLRKSGENA